jgi:hypothetical protein
LGRGLCAEIEGARGTLCICSAESMAQSPNMRSRISTFTPHISASESRASIITSCNFDVPVSTQVHTIYFTFPSCTRPSTSIRPQRSISSKESSIVQVVLLYVHHHTHDTYSREHPMQGTLSPSENKNEYYDLYNCRFSFLQGWVARHYPTYTRRVQ